MPLVVLPLAPGQRQFRFCQTAIVKVYPQRHEGETPLIELSSYPVNLGLMEQQFPLSGRLVLVESSLLVRGDTGAD